VSITSPFGRAIIIFLLIGGLAWIIFFSHAASFMRSDHRADDPASVVAQAPNATSSAPSLIRQVGEEFSVGYWTYRCNAAVWLPAIGRETPDASFLVVDMTIRNNDHTASIMPPMKLIDGQGREYDESSAEIFMPLAFGTLKKLNPGVSSRGYVVFDVLHGSYGLMVSGGYESKNTMVVDLPFLADQQALGGNNPDTNTQDDDAGSSPNR
jgi:hypothetical protein